MEKVLRLYKIPDVGDIVTLLGVGSTLPISDFAEGDLYINDSDDGLYEAQDDGVGGLEWVQVSYDTTKYYRDGSSDVPVFYVYDSQEGLGEYDVSFPANADRIAQITSFTYSATRMGNAPTISGTLMYRQCLDELWDDRVCVFFNKKFYFIDKIPTSEYSNADQRYKHQCEFVSENKLLENVYFTNVVDFEQYEGDITRLPMQWLEFSFFGGITEFVTRLNLSLAYSGLDAQHVGFRVVVDSIGTVEEKLITISDTKLKAALDLIFETWGIPYWFDGYTIHIGYSNEQQMTQAGVTMPTFQYGAVQSLLSLQKSQSNDIVNRITGVGSEENIPYFYPNKNPNAIEIQYERNQTLIPNYAKIVNPYKTVNLEPSESVHQGVPSGSYFKFMPIQKTYKYDQFVGINTHATRIISEDDTETPQLVVAAQESYNVIDRFFTQPYGGTASIIGHANAHFDYNIVCKRIWVWLKEGTTQSIVFTDTMDAPAMFNTDAAQIIFSEGNSNPVFYIKAQSHTYTRDMFEYLIKEENQGFDPAASANLIDDYFVLVTQPTGTKYKWSDNTITDTYEERYPITAQSLPNGTTCISFTVGIKVLRNAAYAEPSKVIPKLKSDTNAVITHNVVTSPDWSLNASGKATHLYKYGIRLNSGVTPEEGDFIYFTREAGALPTFGRLLPYSFRTTKDIWLNAINNHYTKEGSLSSYYAFENLYKISCAKEHVENFDDIKPTIKGMMNNESPANRIDQILDVAFDQDDNNDLDASGENYQHPYFFVKLAKTSANDGYGFNLFDCAIEGQTMKINMADNNCGGCTFEVMVKYQSDGIAYNPIGLFDTATTINGVTYAAGTPKRDLTTGRVLTNLKENDQQDTSAQSVWIALKKDAETFGSDDNGNAVILPDSARGQNFIPETGDSFTILNICLPYAYVVAAEQRLYYALLDYMEKNNPRTWSFNIKFSSIYYKKHYDFMDKWLNESSRVPFVYNSITRTYYVQSYNYKVTENSALPEVTIELQEKVKKLNVLYPVPYNPFENVAVSETTQQRNLRKLITDYLGSLPARDSEVYNLNVSGDITLQDGTSLNGQLTALSSQIFSNERILTPENTWSKIKTAAEVENLFFDGLLKTGENSLSTHNTTSRIVDDITGEFANLSLYFSDDDAYAYFGQELLVEEGRRYTFSFIASSILETSIYAYLMYFDSNDTDITPAEHTAVSLDTNAKRFAILETAPDDAVYAKVCFENAVEDTGITILINKIMILDQNLMTRDQSGNLVPNSMFPTNFKNSTKDFLYQNGGSSTQEVFLCTYSNYTVDKTPKEIYNAKEAGMIVVLYRNAAVYYLSLAQYSNNNYIIYFESIPANTSSPEINYVMYVNGNWIYGTISIQKQLVGSGTGQNIKKINGKNVLGVGNIETEDWQTIVANDGDTGTTITPTTDYTVIFIDNSANSTAYTVTIDTTGIDTVYAEYTSLVVNSGEKSRFDLKKFSYGNSTYLSVKKTDL